MSYVCEICDKKTSIGRSQTHKRGIAGRRWKNRAQMTPRTFKPNLQTKTFVVNGDSVQMRACTKCIKAVKNFGKVKTYKSISVS